MNGKETKHWRDFVQSRLEVDENIERHLEGNTGNPFGPSFRQGQLIITTKRVCFHTQGNSNFIEFQIADIKRAELVKRFVSEVIIGDDSNSLKFNTPESKSYVAEAFSRLEELRNEQRYEDIEISRMDQSLSGEGLIKAEYKVCPDCAEEIKFEARICRYCRYSFVEWEAPLPPPNDAHAAIAMALNISYEEVIPEGQKRAKVYLNDLIDSAKGLGLPPFEVATRAKSLGFRVKSFGRASPPVKVPPTNSITRSLRGSSSMTVIIPIDSGNDDRGSYDAGGDGDGDGD